MDTAVDPTKLIDGLDPEAIREHLEKLDQEQRAWRLLLRAASARQRRLARQEQKGGDDAAR